MSVQVEKYTIYGTPSIGVYVHTDEKITLLPMDIPEKIKDAVNRVLKTKIIRCSIAGSALLGIFSVSNSNGLLVPSIISEKELSELKSKFHDIGHRIVVFGSKRTAVGNLILVNDNGAVASPSLSKKEIHQISDTFDVEVVQMSIAGSPLVGAVAIVTNRGSLVHPLASEEEVETLKDILKVNVDVGTINRGSPYIKLGIIANSNGAIVGNETTGPELMRIHQVLFS